MAKKAPKPVEDAKPDTKPEVKAEPAKAESKPAKAEGGEKEKKSFELLDLKTGEPVAKYAGKQPRGAALKAAATGVTDILLREVGSRDEDRAAVLHRFKGQRKQTAWPLPYPSYVVKTVEKKAGKTMPPELNAKGKEADLKAQGFHEYTYWRPNVEKVARIPVEKVAGKSPIETVQEFVKNMGGK